MPFQNHPLNFREVNMQARLFVMQNDILRKAFGARLKGLRKQKNWPQKVLTAQVGIRFQQLNKYESGLNIPPAEMLVKLADALSVTVDFLLTGSPVEDSPLAGSRLFRRFKVLEALTANEQETVIKVIDAIVAKGRMTSPLAPVDAAA
jgi:transcriptional regulator with XRE-family HTH domain